MWADAMLAQRDPTMPPHYKLAVTLTWLGKYTAVGNESTRAREILQRRAQRQP
jgi:hypothetical protein